MLKSVYDCSVIELPRIENAKGNITPVHSGINLPFEIARIFYLYDIPGGEARGAHAHRECHQFLVAASGSFEVVLALLRFAHPAGYLGCRARLFFGFDLPGTNLAHLRRGRLYP